MDIMNAVEYLESEGVYRDESCKWIYPLIKEVVKGCQITEQLIDKHVKGEGEPEFDFEERKLVNQVK